VKPRNKEQHFALAVLSDDSIHAVSLAGQAGTGKTLLALAVGIHKVLARDRFQRVLVTKPIVPVGRHDLGFLPGKKEDKILPWVQSMVDNLSCLSRGTQRLTWEHLRESKIVEVESVGYLRGRSIANTWMIVDEAQNLTPHEVKTVLSRASEGTKVVLTGDVEQIDAPFMNSNTNGLSHVVQRLRGEPLFAHILFSKTVRSPLAALAASLL
jgi:PhoH-like ATPase